MIDFPILRVVSKLLIPYILLFALYVQFHGDFGPGGGFQAGVIFAAAVILYGLVFGLSCVQRAVKPAVVELCIPLGVLIYAGTGVLTMLFGGNYLQYDVLSGRDRPGHSAPHETRIDPAPPSSPTDPTSAGLSRDPTGADSARHIARVTSTGSADQPHAQHAHDPHGNSHATDQDTHAVGHDAHHGWLPEGQHLGIFLVEFGVGVTVASVMIMIFYAFAGHGATVEVDGVAGDATLQAKRNES